MGRSNAFDTIKIYLRVRPAANPSKNYTIEKEFEHALVRFHLDKNVHREVINNSVEDYNFKFTDVFDKDTQQEQIFDRVAKGCVASALDGYNSTIFAYGQTGSGKTFSITGGSESYQQRGIIPRAIAMIFDELNKKADVDFTVRVSYMQIYNDKGQDLLNKGQDAKTLDELPKVSIQEAEDEFIIKDLGQHRCDRQEDALNLLFLGDTNRMYCETTMNATSSRSHCIFTVSIEQRTPGTAVVKRSKLHLVDLAGSERVKKTGAEGKLLQEARFINLSLHYLQEVITALCDKAEGRRDHIPYRQSLMTMVLRDSLGGNCRTVMLATAHPQDAFMDETISTCKFAQRVASIKTEARINEETDPTLLVKKLKIEVAALREELSMYRTGDQAGDRVLSTDEQEKCKDMVHRYLADNDEDAKLVGLEGDMARFYYCFAFMKEMIRGQPPGAVPRSEGEAPAQVSNGVSSVPGVDPDVVQQLQLQLQTKDNELSMLMSIVQKYQVQKHAAGTQTGQAGDLAQSQGKYTHSTTPSSPPLSRSVPTDASKHDQVKMIALQHKLGADYNLDALDMQGVELLKDTTKAFEEFRKSWRKFEQIEKQKDEQRQRCDTARSLAAAINERSTRIAQIKSRIQQLRAERATQGWDEPDAEERELFAQLDAGKTEYRKLVAELSEEKKVYEHFQGILKGVAAKLTQDFENWWALRKWQMTGGKMDRTESIKCFTEKQFAARQAVTSEVASLKPAPPSAALPPAPVASEPAASQSQMAATYPTHQPRGAAPDSEVQAELQKLFKAREKLRSGLT